jgi:hypothetical protein
MRDSLPTIQAVDTHDETLYVLRRHGLEPLTAYWPHPLLELEPDARWLPSVDEGWCERHGVVVSVAFDAEMEEGAEPARTWPTVLEGRRPQPSKISVPELRELHARHWAHDVSIRQIARENWEIWGYKNARSAANTIFEMLPTHGLHVRPRASMTAVSNRQRSMRLPGETRNEFKARRRREKGQVRDVMCKGVRASYPRKGAPCSRPALAGSEFCVAHDPERREEILHALERGRAMVSVR